jgi:hypothetical protein
MNEILDFADCLNVESSINIDLEDFPINSEIPIVQRLAIKVRLS